MKILLIILSVLLIPALSIGQQENPVQPGSVTEQQLENLTEQQEGETEDDTYLQALVQLRKYGLNINTADENELKELRLLSDLQIQSLLSYRRLLGSLISIYELQAIPGWDLETITRVLPYMRVSSTESMSTELSKRFIGGQNSLLLRVQQILEKSAGYKRPDTVATRYPGSPQRVFFRYKYVYRNLLQYGITAEKDAGEQFFRGKQKQGFDFYSFHLFARKIGPFKLLAVGDFTANLGQGLIQWQSLAFKKSVEITNVKRQADVLRPYNAAGEYNFLRGVGATIALNKNIDITGFASIRQVDGTVNTGDTAQSNEDFISSVLTSGFHRTATEANKKNTLTQTGIGGNISYRKEKLHLGLNGVAFKFSNPIIRDVQTYNQYAISGRNWYNASIDYSYTLSNVHLFGEVAMDKNRARALVAGMLANLSPKVDASLVYRNIQKNYQALYGNAFTESTFPTNEKGLFTGLSFKPFNFLRIDAYSDIFSFPWLRYRVDAPTSGSEYLFQVTYKPNKQVEVYTRFRNENKAINISGLELPTRFVVQRPRQNWRTQISYNVSKEITLRNRVEIVWFDRQVKERSQQGFLGYVEGKYKPFGKPISFNTRLQYFETEGYDSRLYAFENDVLYSFSIPQFSGKGFRYYVNLNYDISRNCTAWIRWAQTIYSNVESLSTGLDKIDGNRRSEVKFQILYTF